MPAHVQSTQSTFATNKPTKHKVQVLLALALTLTMAPSVGLGQESTVENKNSRTSLTSVFSNPHWFFNADESRVAIGGYDPVSYFLEGTAKLGKSDFQYEHDSLIYHFSSAKNADLFQASPKKYLPMYGGWCAFVAGRTPEKQGAPPSRFRPDPTNFLIHQDKLFLFVRAQSLDIKEMWKQNADEFIRDANKFWQTRLELGKKYPSKPKGLNPLARMETMQFDFLIGKWESEYSVRTSLKSDGVSTVKGTWHAWYGWNGFAVYDDWKQVGTPSGNSGPAIRSFDPLNQQWVMHYIPINAPMETVWQMTATANEAGEIHGIASLSDGLGNSFEQRIHFVDIKPNEFTWRSDRSYDGGETWIENWGVGKNRRVTKTNPAKVHD